MKISTMEDLNKLRSAGLKSLSPKQPKLSVSMSTCGHALGADTLYHALVREKEKQELKLSIGQVGCSGFCDLEPMAILRMHGRPTLLYTQMTGKKVKRIIEDLKEKRISKEGVFCTIEDPFLSEEPEAELNEIPGYKEVPPFKDQHRRLLENCGIINPLSVSEYAATGGYTALYKALYQMDSEQVVEEVIQSGLRGRGGAWFPTGIKWDMARKTQHKEKFVICNADEGDPGAYKDRTIMEGNPFKLFEGIVLAGYAIGSHQGIIYLREEYPYTYEFLNDAVDTAKRYGFLGKNILGSNFNFTLKIIRGGGSYVCGEETALMDSLEGEVGDPRLRPPFPIEKGLWERPTIVNNVETLANIPHIIAHGGESYAGIGTEKAKGTKILSVIGKVKQPGLYEVPLGTNLEHVIFNMAGGPLNGRKIKAVQVGSPFGSFLPGEKLDISLDPETLRAMGSMIGSGVIVVLDQDTCLVDILLHSLSFFVEESCGKCVPCREGVFQMKEILTAIYEGRSTMEDLTSLHDLGGMIKDFALCALGGGAPSIVLNGIKDFRKDFEAHITTGQCPWIS